MLLFVFSVIAESYAGRQEIPFLTGRVVDNAQILSPESIKLLSDSLKVHEMRTTNQVVVLTTPALRGISIEDYAYTVFNEWKLGQKGKDNGILIIVAPQDRSMRIEVGYGLEGTMTDLLANRIIQNIMTPKFRNGDYNGGITEGTSAVISILEGSEPEDLHIGSDETANTLASGLSGLEGPDLSILERILFGAFIFGIIGLFTVLGILTPGFGWFLYFFLIPFWATFPIVVLGTRGTFIILIIYLIGFPATKLLLKQTKWYKKAVTDLQTKGKASIGGFSFSSGSSVGSGSSGRSWSSGGGGFSGGGGRSGGGGSSGSW
ncbi:MAG: YgcG family protein [Prolixibacteraceae bacterium]|nr:YgcG family protein [Prolixibacteraceae bacterium]